MLLYLAFLDETNGHQQRKTEPLPQNVTRWVVKTRKALKDEIYNLVVKIPEHDIFKRQ